MKKKIIKVIIFLLIFGILLHYVMKILWYPPTAVSYFYKEPKNSLDVVYIGSSNAFIHFNSVLAYNLYGYTTGFLSADTQPISLAKNLIKESEKYQNPSVYIIDLATSTEDLKLDIDNGIRKTVDSMKFSKNRIEAINESLKYIKDIDKKDYIGYYFSFLMYHNRWRHISPLNFTGNTSLYKGYQFAESTTKVVPQNPFNWLDEKSELPQENTQVLKELIDYIKANNLNVIFVVPIRYFEPEYNRKLNKVIEIIQKNNINVLNFNTLEDFNEIDFSKDYYNSAHLNVYGATKYTLYLSRYIKEHYDIINHKEDENYKSWNSEYERFKAKYKEITKQDFNEFLMSLKNRY